MSRRGLLAPVVLLLARSASSGQDSFTIDLLALEKSRAAPQAVTIITEDPLFKRRKSYQGYDLKTLLLKAAGAERTKPSETEVIFQCADGYSPTLSLDKALSARGVVAFRDFSAPAGEQWEPLEKGSKRISLSPFYLVWEAGESLDASFPWPYQLVGIKLAPQSEVFRGAFPKRPSPGALHGFNLFKAKCLRCHSINRVGGAMGPELNVPRNVTEYWKVRELKKFIRKPAGFRLNSSMPGFPELSDKDLDAIVNYLKAMRG